MAPAPTAVQATVTLAIAPVRHAPGITTPGLHNVDQAQCQCGKCGRTGQLLRDTAADGSLMPADVPKAASGASHAARGGEPQGLSQPLAAAVGALPPGGAVREVGRRFEEGSPQKQPLFMLNGGDRRMQHRSGSGKQFEFNFDVMPTA